jgi:hypothetical protein
MLTAAVAKKRKHKAPPAKLKSASSDDEPPTRILPRRRAKLPTRKKPTSRRSNRLEKSEFELKSHPDVFDMGTSYIDKLRDGFEEQRTAKSLKTLTHYSGGNLFEGNCDQATRDSVNHRKRASQNGGDPCYDVIDELGSSIYAYSLPLNLIRGLLQGFKSDRAVDQFTRDAKTLASHTGTNYMFLHWLRGGDESASGDYKRHKFVTERPDLMTTIESLGNYVCQKILRNPRLATTKQPGLLSNMKIVKDLVYQTPHWDFGKWGAVPAREMPWILHIPMCKEGMMLHVWPTQRDPLTHHLEVEALKIGDPKLVYVAFGDALLLRADVCHGGCFGSRGNVRFHMVLRPENCTLCPKELQLLKLSGVNQQEFKAKEKQFENLLGNPERYFRDEVKRKNKTVVAYITKLKALFPCDDSWCEGLLEPLPYK